MCRAVSRQRDQAGADAPGTPVGRGRGVSRRTLLGGVAAGVLAACVGAEPVVRTAPSGRPSPTRLAEAETGTGAVAADPQRFEPVPGDVLLDAKRLAGRMAVALTTYAAGEDAMAVAARALRPMLSPGSAAPRVPVEAVAAAAAPLVVPGTDSAGRVVYPQLGGESFAQDTCSVMVVTEQRLASGTITRTLDLRLRLTGRGWAFEGVASAGGDPVPRPPDLSAIAAQVLDDARITLPDSARWDIHAGRIDDRLLATMQAMAGMFPYAVTCLASGHPPQVFDTARTSNHTTGRAVDVWRVGDLPVVAQQAAPATPAHRMHQALHDLGEAEELGGPWDLDAGGRRSFTDRVVHKDHLHVAFFA